MQNVVPAMKSKEPREYKLRAFVGFLFLTVVFLVAFAYIFYYQQLSRVSLLISFFLFPPSFNLFNLH